MLASQQDNTSVRNIAPCMGIATTGGANDSEDEMAVTPEERKTLHPEETVEDEKNEEVNMNLRGGKI